MKRKKFNFMLISVLVLTSLIMTLGASCASVGDPAGQTVETMWDSDKIGSVTVGTQTGSLCAGTGGSVTYPITVYRKGGLGCYGSFDADLSITTVLPTGASASFSPNPVHFNSWDNAKTSTLTITTTSATPGGTTPFTVEARRTGSGSDYKTGTGTLTIVGCTTYYKDNDGDGYGNSTDSKCLCGPSGGYSITVGGDCNDSDPDINPGATEVCNGIDDDCDGEIDEGLMNTYYGDADGDGYGDAANSTQACSQPSGYVSDNTDCDDADSTVYPGAPELCDGKDNNCNCVIDEGCPAPPSTTANLMDPCEACKGLTIFSTEGGEVITPGEGLFPYLLGMPVYLVAVPDVGYQFLNWTGNVSSIADVNDATTTLIIEDWCSITANFEKE